ncbi:carbon-nitrogen hydrolase family protein [Bradyrhizobium sp. CCBAU 25338]|uniref:carbon-nitrogen hydrolase family protein n=1 Tax=Bradyrhizobium sp. CCBAU 25338 TaxID=1641877 RepID=UPI0023035CDC|nr:carbon-nitrogen hydrolase family protein [Bradyrhizobium sp. CCBAU 25338]
MTSYDSKFRAAAIQAEPVWMDVDATIDKTIAMMEEAARNGAQIMATPEVWLPGYPQFIWVNDQLGAYSHYLKYHENSLELGDERMQRIQRAAAFNNIAIILGYSEREGGSRYMAQAFIDQTGEIVGNRRKLKPSHAERTLYGEGKGIDFFTHDFPFGRVGALQCWEHFQPLNKQLMYSLGEQVHIASWPALFAFRQHVFQFGLEANETVTRSYALEGQVFVIAASQLIGEATLDYFGNTEERRGYLAGPDGKSPVGGGWARIFGPDGSSLADPLPEHIEGIIYGDIDLSAIILAKGAADPVGHYARPDVLSLNFDNREHRPLRYVGDNGAAAPAALSRVEMYRQKLLAKESRQRHLAVQHENHATIGQSSPMLLERPMSAEIEPEESKAPRRAGA